MMRATVLLLHHVSVLLAAVTILGLVLTACGDQGNTSPPPTAGASAVAPGAGPPTTAVPVPAAAPIATGTPVPVATPVPARTPAPPATPGSTPSQPVVTFGKVDGYMALAPAVLRSGQTEHVSVSLFSGNQPAAGDVHLALLRDGGLVAESNTFIEGTGTAPLMVPSLPAGA